MTGEDTSAAECRVHASHVERITPLSFSHGAVFLLSGSGNAAYRGSSASLGLGVVHESPRHGVRFLISIHPAVNCDKLDVTSSCFSFVPWEEVWSQSGGTGRYPTVNWPGLSRVGARCHSDKGTRVRRRAGRTAHLRNGSRSRSLLSRELIAR